MHHQPKEPPSTPAPKPPPTPSPDPSLLDRISQLEQSTQQQFDKITNQFDELAKNKKQEQQNMISAVTTAVTQVMNTSLPQLIADQLKVAATNSGGETH